jgi:subtilisin family serine protease
MLIRHQLEISVDDINGQTIENVKVTASPEALGPVAEGKFDSGCNVYFFDGVRPGFFGLRLEHPGYQSQEARIQVHPKPTRISFRLNQPEIAYTFRGGTRVPYTPLPGLIGVIPSLKDVGPESANKLDELFTSLGLVRVESQPMEQVSEDAAFQVSAPIPRPAVLQRAREPQERRGITSQGIDQMAALRSSPLVAAAGPLFARSGPAFAIFTNRLMIRFLPDVTTNERDRLLTEHGLRLIREIAFSPNLFLAEADASVNEEAINRIAEAFLNSGRAIYADPSIAEVRQLDTITPANYLWCGAWDRWLVGVQEAWQLLHDNLSKDAQFGRHTIIIAVVDEGIQSAHGTPVNPDFNVTVSNRSKKVYRLFDFSSRMAPDNDVVHNHHGVACASVASATVKSAGRGRQAEVGVGGAAPNTRLIGLIPPDADQDVPEMFIWAAGLDARSMTPGFPHRINPGADIFTCSIGLGYGGSLMGPARDMLDHITSRGRGAKGCLAIFSAGNDASDMEMKRPYGSYERSFSCAASTIDADGAETHAMYSNSGNIAWCTPSSTEVSPVRHEPPTHYGTWAASLLENGTLPSLPATTTRLAMSAKKGQKRIAVRSALGLEVGKYILVGCPCGSNSEAVPVRHLPGPPNDEVRIRALKNDHFTAEDVVSGPNHHRNDFGGTSSATPLSAGICALVLSAAPDLTWVEAREILRSTAIKFDLQNSNAIGQWLDEDCRPSRCSGKPPVFSEWYGYGRLDACGAVKAALEYKFTRDLMIREDLCDNGCGPTKPSSDSPDIWVRNSDPSADLDAVPARYDQAGPHQDPSRGTNRWIYTRVKNRGTEQSLDAWVRFYVASSNRKPFIFPNDWEPVNGRCNKAKEQWERGTYWIGEVALPAIAAGEDLTVNIPWPDGLMPPPFTPAGDPWNPHLLVEITPLDGPLKGKHTYDNNNLAEKAVTISE